MDQPDLIFILADDLGSADLGCYGGLADTSPTLDRLAAEGLLFERGYANSAVCSPTRFALMTGRYQYRLRGAAEEPLGRASSTLGLPADHPTLASLLKAAGYDTALIGKWHLGALPTFGPLKSGYDEFFGPMSGAVDYFSYRNSGGHRDLWEGEAPSPAQGYLTDLISQRAAQVVAKARDKPYFLSVHYTAPHWPWETREDEEESRNLNGAITHLDGGSVATYLKMVQQMDEGIARIVAAIRPERRSNTFIVFTSDNGGERFSNNWPTIGGKMDLLEGGLRVPAIAWWPQRIAAGARSAALAITMDWMPTFLKAAGAQPSPSHPVDGVDLSPLWTPGSELAPLFDRQLFWRMKHRSQAALIHGAYKYLRIEGIEYLFNVVNDGRERANLAKREPGRLVAMREQWAHWEATMLAIPPEAQVHLLWNEADMPRPTH
jgi:arylsulfatase A-like enzyme